MKNIRPDEYRLWVIFNQTSDLLKKCDEDLANRLNSSSRQFFMLWMMKFSREVTKAPIIISDFAPAIVRSINNLSALINRMEKNGFVKRVRKLADRRTVELTITSKGEEEFNKYIGPQTELMQKLFSVYSDEEIQILFSLLKKLKIKALQEINIDAAKIDPADVDSEYLKHFIARVLK